MKSAITIRSRLTVAILLSALTGCDPDDKGSPLVIAGCRLRQQTATTGSGNASRTDYAYDALGHLSQTRHTSEAQMPDGSRFTTLSTTFGYAYDAQGYLTSSNSEWVSRSPLTDGRVHSRTRTGRTTYTYANGRLAGYVSTSSGTGRPTLTVTGGYSYDDKGNLVKETALYEYRLDPAEVKELPAYPSGWQRSWTLAAGQLVDYAEKTETGEIRPYTVSDGLVTVVTFPGSRITYRYDAQRRLSRRETYIGNALNSYETYTYTDGKPALSALPAFKGFPAVQSPIRQDIDPVLGQAIREGSRMGEDGIIEQFSFFADFPGRGMIQLTESTQSNGTNEQGFLIGSTVTNRDLSPNRPPTDPTTTSERVSYTHCQ